MKGCCPPPQNRDENDPLQIRPVKSGDDQRGQQGFRHQQQDIEQPQEDSRTETLLFIAHIAEKVFQGFQPRNQGLFPIGQDVFSPAVFPFGPGFHAVQNRFLKVALFVIKQVPAFASDSEPDDDFPVGPVRDDTQPRAAVELGVIQQDVLEQQHKALPL